MALQTQNVGSGQVTVFTSTNEQMITFASFCNRHTSLVYVDVYLVPSGSSVGNDNIIIKQLEMQPNDTYILYQGGEKIAFENGDSMVVEADVASVITTVISHVGL